MKNEDFEYDFAEFKEYFYPCNMVTIITLQYYKNGELIKEKEVKKINGRTD